MPDVSHLTSTAPSPSCCCAGPAVQAETVHPGDVLLAVDGMGQLFLPQSQPLHLTLLRA
jgi:hypothetical protein